MIYPAPKANDPVSPMNIEAGYLFSARKPDETPASAINGIEPSTFPTEIEKIAHAVEAIANIPVSYTHLTLPTNREV